MSHAFLKDAEDQAVEFADRPISPHRNLVTEAGFAAIDIALSQFEATHRAAIEDGDRQATAAALREMRYWRAQRASAEIVKAPTETSHVAFGMTVQGDGREESFRIVGEDEADFPRGTISYVSPLARAAGHIAVETQLRIAGQEALILDVRECLHRSAAQRPNRGKEDHAERVLATSNTQQEAIASSKGGPCPGRVAGAAPERQKETRSQARGVSQASRSD